ncbi:MAG: mannose-binding protein [Streptomyces sp.]
MVGPADTPTHSAFRPDVQARGVREDLAARKASDRPAAATATGHAETGIKYPAVPTHFDADKTNPRMASGTRPARPPSGLVHTDSSAPEEYRMSSQHRTPGAKSETTAAPTGEAGPSTAPSAPDEKAKSTAPDEAATPSTPDENAASEAAEAPETPKAPEAESATSPAGEATKAAPASPSGTPKEGQGESEAEGENESAAVAAAAAAAVGTPPSGTKSVTGVDGVRPRKPVLAGAAIVGAALIAIPLLLVGSARDDGPPDNGKELSAGGSDTVLNPNSGPAALDDYQAKKPSSSPSKKKSKKPETPKAVAPKAVVPTPEPSPSKSPEKKAKSKPKPKAAPKPNWTAETVSAPSVLEVKQAWTTNRIRMVMQTDGNLVVYNEKGKPLWASMTFGENHRAIFQQDGNLVIHNGDDRPIWASKSHGHEGAQLVLRPDAKVVIVHNGRVVWST